MDPREKYVEIQSSSASPMQQVAMMYESALKFVQRCRRLRREGRFEEASAAAAKAQAILSELTLHLDRRAGELADLFMDNYTAIYALIAKGQIDRDDDALASAEDLLHGLLDTWREAMKDFRRDVYGV